LSNQSIKIKALLTTIILSLLFIYNPLGLRTAAEKHNEDLILQLFSPFFAESSSKEISVILLDDAFLEQIGTFPVSYAHLARVLKIISNHQPDAVFFDILQHYEHSSRLNKWIGQIEKSDFPVLLASDPEYDNSDRLNNPQSLRHQLAKHADFAAVTWSGSKHYYPLYVNWNNTEMPTTATALYRLWCKNNTTKCSIPVPNTIKGSDYYNQPMIVQWSNKSSQKQEKLFPLKGSCQNTESSPFSQLLTLVKTYLQIGVSTNIQVDKVTRKACTQVLAIAASTLYQPGAMKSELLREAIEGRMILVGYGLTGSSDTVVSPVNGTIAGVFYHAVALDNLIQFSGNYWHVPADIGNYSFNQSDLLEVIVQAMVLFMVITYRYNYIENRNSDELAEANKSDIWNAVKPVMFICLIMFISILISHYVLHLGLVNWYALPMILILDLPIFLFFVMSALKTRLKKFSNHSTVLYIHQTPTRIKLISMLYLKSLYGESYDKTNK
jgi:hypothetical protein